MADSGIVNVSEQQWRVPHRVVILKIVVAAAFIGIAWWFSADIERFVVAVVVAGLLAAYAVRDLVWPVRLSVGPDGVAVSRGFVLRRQIAWGEIERLRIDRRQRLGTASELLEIDLDSTLYLFSKHELDDTPQNVLDALHEWRSTHRDNR